MKKLIIPAILLSIGTGAAFATNAGKASAPVAGYRLINVGGTQTLCVETGETCSDIDGPVCKWSVDGTSDLREFDTTTMCGEVLHRVPPQ